MPEIHFDRYYRYDDLTRLLQAFVAEYPDLIQLESLGQSYEGRDIWLVTVTNVKTDPADEKPAYWIDGNIHASEVSPSSAALYLINKLATSYGSDDSITDLLNTRAFYICPRVNPDGAEWALADKPKLIRSSTRPYPYDEDPIGGLVTEDIDGDGRMLQMRVEDPNGPWKSHPDEPRLLVRREPEDANETFYRVFPEGEIENYDGVRIWVQPNKEGLDLNRNFPFEWRQDGEQAGAGPYPTSEPEVHAIVDFIGRHKNIVGGISFHTWSGVILRPYGTKDDDEIPAEDLWTFKMLGDRGTGMTGYPNVSVFHDFKYHPKEVITGVFDDWLYDHFGAYGWTIEIWSPQRQAGIDDYKFIDWYREHSFEDDMKMLTWSDEKLDGKGYVDWYAYDHPQLGKVELGGWDMFYAWRNPPPKYLEAEIAPLVDWAIWNAKLSPRLEWFCTAVTPLGDDAYHVEVAVQNTGWLPSYVSKQALARKVVRGVVAEVDLPDGATLKTGKAREDLGQLEGRAYVGSSATPWALFSTANTADRARGEWVVHAPDGGTIKLTVKHERAGVVRTELTLG